MFPLPHFLSLIIQVVHICCFYIEIIQEVVKFIYILYSLCLCIQLQSILNSMNTIYVTVLLFLIEKRMHAQLIIKIQNIKNIICIIYNIIIPLRPSPSTFS